MKTRPDIIQFFTNEIVGFIKSTNYRPPTTYHRPTDHRLTDHPTQSSYLKDLATERFSFYGTLTQLRKLLRFIIYCIWWIIFVFTTLNICERKRVAHKINTKELMKYIF